MIAETAILRPCPRGRQYHPFRQVEAGDRAPQLGDRSMVEMVTSPRLTVRRQSNNRSASSRGGAVRTSSPPISSPKKCVVRSSRNTVTRRFTRAGAFRTYVAGSAAADCSAQGASGRAFELRRAAGASRSGEDNRDRGDWASRPEQDPTLSDVPEWKTGSRALVDSEGAEMASSRKRKSQARSCLNGLTGRIAAKNMQWAYRSAGRKAARNAKSPEGSSGRATSSMSSVARGRRISAAPARRFRADWSRWDPHTGRVLANVGRFSSRTVRVQPRTSGDAPAPFRLQALRLRGRPRQRLYAGIGHSGCAYRDRRGRSRSGARKLRRRPLPDRRAPPRQSKIAQPDDGPACQRPGHEHLAEYCERFGIYDKMRRFLRCRSGSGETTVLRLVSAMRHRQWRQSRSSRR